MQRCQAATTAACRPSSCSNMCPSEIACAPHHIKCMARRRMLGGSCERISCCACVRCSARGFRRRGRPGGPRTSSELPKYARMDEFNGFLMHVVFSEGAVHRIRWSQPGCWQKRLTIVCTPNEWSRSTRASIWGVSEVNDSRQQRVARSAREAPWAKTRLKQCGPAIALRVDRADADSDRVTQHTKSDFSGMGSARGALLPPVQRGQPLTIPVEGKSPPREPPPLATAESSIHTAEKGLSLAEEPSSTSMGSP
eukprot:scaffold226192_cov40-Tisochrysis_lutea.AAC.3